MDLDDAASRPPTSRLTPLLLGPLGVAELQSYIEDLRREIARTEAEIVRKSAHRSGADAVFRALKP